MPLSEEQQNQIDALAKHHGRVGHVEFDGHVLVFRRPSRDQIKDYRRKEDSPAEKSDRVDQLLNQTIVSFDGVTDAVRCREAFLAFIGEYPLFADNPKVQSVVAVLAGMVEESESRVLGKGCGVWRGTPKT